MENRIRAILEIYLDYLLLRILDKNYKRCLISQNFCLKFLTMYRIKLILIGSFILISLQVFSATYYVKTDGDDSTSGTSWGCAFKTITKALEEGSVFDRIWVAEGTYKQTETLQVGSDLFGGFAGNESSLEERNLSEHATIIQGDGNHLCIDVAHSTIFNGFHVTNGGWGGVYNSGVLVNCIIYNNSGDSFGGVHNDMFGKIYNCIVHDNTATFNESCGGIDNQEGVVFNCLVYNNNSPFCGGICHDWGYIYNCTCFGNDRGGILTSGSELNNCISWGNAEFDIAIYTLGIYTGKINHCCYSEAPDENGHIKNDPLFVNTTGDIAGWDFHLQDGSPCIDAGDPDGKYNDGCLPPGKGNATNDMGAYGGPQNCRWVQFCVGSCDMIGVLLGRKSLEEEIKPYADLNNDESIDIADLAKMFILFKQFENVF